MTERSSNSRTVRRERALQAARQRLKRLEIEAHRIKAELARLEAANADDLADELSSELRGNGDETSDGTAGCNESAASGMAAAAYSASRDRISVQDMRAGVLRAGAGAVRPVERQSAPVIAVAAGAPASGGRQRAGSKVSRRTSPAWWMSVAVHAAILLLCVPWSFTILSNDNFPLSSSLFDADETALHEPPSVEFELVNFEQFDPLDSHENVLEESPLNLADSLADDFLPVVDSSSDVAAAALGQLDSLPSNVGTLMAGAGRAEGRGRAGRSRGRRAGSTSFFGTEAVGDRFVYLVDNSGSMKQGRMETTIFELLRSVETLTEAQSFYVIFYSDQAYPMFYPEGIAHAVAATPANKQKLYQWLQTVELCYGGKLLEAMDLAVSLRPDVVFILSDGDISSTRTMERLTQRNDWEFVIHTLGMGVKKPEHAANLAAIAQTHRGVFHVVQPSPAAVQMARMRPIPSNKSGQSWGTAPAAGPP